MYKCMLFRAMFLVAFVPNFGFSPGQLSGRSSQSYKRRNKALSQEPVEGHHCSDPANPSQVLTLSFYLRDRDSVHPGQASQHAWRQSQLSQACTHPYVEITCPSRVLLSLQFLSGFTLLALSLADLHMFIIIEL